MYLLAIIFPPLAVLLSGKPFQFLLNCGLTLCFWVPGMIHAFMVVADAKAERRTDRIVRGVARSRSLAVFALVGVLGFAQQALAQPAPLTVGEIYQNAVDEMNEVLTDADTQFGRISQKATNIQRHAVAGRETQATATWQRATNSRESTEFALLEQIETIKVAVIADLQAAGDQGGYQAAFLDQYYNPYRATVQTKADDCQTILDNALIVL